LRGTGKMPLNPEDERGSSVGKWRNKRKLGNNERHVVYNLSRFSYPLEFMGDILKTHYPTIGYYRLG